MLSLDISLPGQQLHIRKSMTKYVAKEGWKDLELCNAGYQPLKVFLNHQFIKILEDLGVPAKNFKAVQDEAVHELKLVTEHPLNAASFLGKSGTSFVTHALKLHFLLITHLEILNNTNAYFLRVLTFWNFCQNPTLI